MECFALIIYCIYMTSLHSASAFREISRVGGLAYGRIPKMDQKLYVSWKPIILE